MHDWEHEPFARGAYSYSIVGGAEAPRRWRGRSADAVFAGEASTRGPHRHGARRDRQRHHAAKQVLRSLQDVKA